MDFPISYTKYFCFKYILDIKLFMNTLKILPVSFNYKYYLDATIIIRKTTFVRYIKFYNVFVFKYNFLDNKHSHFISLTLKSVVIENTTPKLSVSLSTLNVSTKWNLTYIKLGRNLGNYLPRNNVFSMDKR